MKNYLEKLLHINADLLPFSKISNLPLYLRGGYELNTLRLAGIISLLAKPKGAVTFAALRKHREQLKMLSGMECVLCFETLDTYKKQKMISESIPFIIEGKQVFLPFLGIVLEKEKNHITPTIKKLGISTQRLIITAIYENWTEIQLNEIAKYLNTSKMTISRCLDEMDALALDMTLKAGKTRAFKWSKGKKALWGAVRPLLSNPVCHEYKLDTIIPIQDGVLGGMSAVCHYSMLSDNGYPTYAVTRNDDRLKKYYALPRVPRDEVPAIAIQVMPYMIPYIDKVSVDPLTAILSLTEEENEDPRVENAVNGILEEVLNG
ncbi:MAG TPA: hypothetical protein DD640_09490, partial [Clostridiales bacterium]|nr:hypothetical protein [Clostridiales bacterium]